MPDNDIPSSSGQRGAQEPYPRPSPSVVSAPPEDSRPPMPPPTSLPTPSPFPALPDVPQAMPAAPSMRVVVADDNPVVRAGLTVLLSGRDDIEVVAEAADGRQAYEQAVLTHPDVILLDVRMPGVDGISALPHLARLAPVLMMTYSRESHIVHEALRLGAGGYLVHGEFTADQLVHAVRDIRQGRAHFTHSASSALLATVRATGGGGPLPEGLGTAFTGPGYVPVASEQPSATAHVPAFGQPSFFPSTNLQVGGVGEELNAQQFSPNPSLLQSDVAHSSEGRSRTGSPGPPGHAEGPHSELSRREVEIMDLIASGMTNQQIAAACFISQKTVKNHINRIFAKLDSASRGEAMARWTGTARGRSNSRG
ncbi:response regulator [Streptomyces sp. NPDC087658]|uniref:response regulator n=1 Tax=Streptomyces sp. NPDC087658 TaxID=3365800 RepID=UPI00381BB0ED